MEDKKFNPINLDKLNNPNRLEMLDPGKIWRFINLEAPEKIIDIGAGTGFITSALSDLAPEATIDAFDIEPLMVEAMKTGFPENSNVKPRLMEDNKLPVENEYADLVWMINLYHELNKPYKLLREIKRVLRPGGKLLIIDWAKKPEACESGPPLEHRVEEATMTSHLIESDFLNIITTDEFEHHLGVVAEK